MNAHRWAVKYTADKYDSAHSVISIIDDSPESHAHPQGLLTLAGINVGAFAPHTEHALEIANLMASAPELLAALRYVADFAPTMHRRTKAENDVVLKRVLAAITKAEGRA